tara:strand:- start:2766 stop:2945 length:180 start_codon:yes stop_codon:yes gene_type:complete
MEKRKPIKIHMVRPERIELSWENSHLALNQACLPISAWPHLYMRQIMLMTTSFQVGKLI